MLYKALVLSVGLLGSTAISASFAGKVEQTPEKGRVARRIAELNKSKKGPNIRVNPQSGATKVQKPPQIPIGIIQALRSIGHGRKIILICHDLCPIPGAFI